MLPLAEAGLPDLLISAGKYFYYFYVRSTDFTMLATSFLKKKKNLIIPHRESRQPAGCLQPGPEAHLGCRGTLAESLLQAGPVAGTHA